MDYQGLKSDPSVLDHYLDSLAGISVADGDYLKSGGYSVKYLDYDWSLNEK